MRKIVILLFYFVVTLTGERTMWYSIHLLSDFVVDLITSLTTQELLEVVMVKLLTTMKVK